MRFAILADIHGNLEALEAVLDRCARQKVDAILCAGDIVGYGANPEECLELIKECRAVSVAGNHDWAVAGKLDASYFTDDGKAAIHWTRNQLSMDSILQLNALELTYANDHFEMVHASPQTPSRFIYLDALDKITPAFHAMRASLCFVGHTHVPGIYRCVDGQVNFSPQDECEISEDCRYLVNVGSVGQPRDGNPLASYGLYDTDLNTLSIQRQTYNISRAQKKILDAGLPQALARRLADGA